MIIIFAIKMDNACLCFCYICCVLELTPLHVHVLIDKTSLLVWLLRWGDHNQLILSELIAISTLYVSCMYALYMYLCTVFQTS